MCLVVTTLDSAIVDALNRPWEAGNSSSEPSLATSLGFYIFASRAHVHI